MSFVFDPERVSRVLDALPALKAQLRPPEQEGRASAAFAGQRVTTRALYRMLANPHYPHLREALRAIDNVIAAGISLKELRNAQLRGDFGSFFAEVLVADDFLQRGFTVARGAVGAGGRNADLEIDGGDISATIEVYSPRSWQAREDWMQDVVDALRYADVPYEFTAAVRVDTGAIPWTAALIEDVSLRTGGNVLARLATDIASLRASTGGSSWQYAHEGGEMVTTVEFQEVARNGNGPAREILTSPPGEAFQANAVFAGVLGKVREKAERRQARSGAGQLKGLLVDMGRSGIDYELERGGLGLDPATAGLDLDDVGLDFVALTIPNRGKEGPRRGVRLASLLFENTRATEAQLKRLFGT